MKRLRIIAAFAVALLVCGPGTSVYGGQPTPPFFSFAGGHLPEAAPSPPYLTIRASSASAVIEWHHPDPTLTGYETWRAELPYFDPEAGEGVKLGSYSFSQGIYAEFAPFSYFDNGSCGYFIAAYQQLPCSPQNPTVIVVGDSSREYFWIVRAGNGEWADSNRVGAFAFSLIKGD